MQSKRAQVLLGLCLVGLGLRLATVVAALHGPYHPSLQLKEDMGSYVALAVSWVKGEGYSLHYYNVLTEFSRDPKHVRPQEPPRPTAIKAVGYPLFLAAIFRTFGFHLPVILFVQAILSTLSALLVYAIGCLIGNKRIAMAATAISVFYYPFWHAAVTLMTETLLIFLLLLSLYGLIRWFTRPSVLTGCWTGLALGASFLVRPFLIPFALLVLLAAALRCRHDPQQRRGFVTAALSLAGAVTLTLTPLAMRNYRQCGRPLVTPTFGGYYLLVLYNPYNDQWQSYSDPGNVSEGYPGFQDRLLPKLRAQVPEGVSPVRAETLLDQLCARTAVQFILQNPIFVLKTIPRTFCNTWRFDYPRASLVRKLSNLVFYIGLIPFFLWGTALAARSGSHTALLVLGFFLYFLLFHTLTVSQIRYRILVMPVYFLLASFGLVRMWERISWKPSTSP